MRASLEVIKTATRVLSALTDNQPPNPEDVQALREYDHSTNGRDVDELACDVIQKALHHRAEVRGRRKPQ
jgi:hypothetical protein